MKTKNNATTKAEASEEHEEEVYPLVYNMPIENLTINVYEGGKVVFQQGKPKDPPPTPPGP